MKYQECEETKAPEHTHNKVTIVETVTLINDRRADGYSIDEIISLIRKLESKILHLNSINIKSNAIEAIKKKHRKTIMDLVEILDSREVTSE